ncbi:MAG: aldo/keto reductase [Anaerolineae bacterium]|nr:aldo/keto reductase [Anaerolineae bacterium]
MIEKMEFGRTGHLSTRVIFGAAALGSVSQEVADRALEVLLQYGINHIDTAASYGDAELRIGPWMERHRQEFFLATKSGERTFQGAWDELQRSLERMRVDYVDLWQLHFLVDPQEWETAMGPGGALEAFVKAKEEGLTRFLGVTGHGWTAPRMLLRSLERFDFDAVLLPYNYVVMQNPAYAADFEELLRVCQERKVAMQTMKSIARGPWGEKTRTRYTWYEPLEAQADIDRAVHWVLARPSIFLISAGDVHLLPKVLDAATRFQAAPTDEEMQEMVSRLHMSPIFE